MGLPDHHSHVPSEARGSSTATRGGHLTRRVPRTPDHTSIQVTENQGRDPPPNQPRHDRPESEPRPGDKLKRVLGYSFCVLINIFSIVVAYHSARKDITQHAEKLYMVICGVVVFTTFLTDFILMMFTICLRTFRRISDYQYKAAIILIYFSNVLLMLTSVGLLVLLDKRYACLAVFLLPIIAILGILWCKEIQTAQNQRATDYKNYETEMRRCFDLSASVTSLTFTGMMGTISFYFKNFNEKTGHLGVTVSESFMFFNIIFGLLAMLLTTVPPSFSEQRTRERLITVIRALGYLLFGLQALTGLEVAAGFVNGFVVLAFLPDFVGAVFWFHEEFFNEQIGGDEQIGGEAEREISSGQVNQERGNDDEPETFAIPVTIFIFTMLMTVYSIYRGDQEYSFHLKSCMLFIFSAFMSSLSWMMLTLKPPTTESSETVANTLKPPTKEILETVANILTYFTVGLLVLAVLDVASFAILEFQHINQT